VLGWQGLVPKNKDQIAKSLAESVQEQLLSPEIILAYIRERELIEAGTNTIADWVDRNLQDPKVRTRITRLLVDLMQDKGPDALTRSMDYVEEALKAAARNPEAIDAWWQEIRGEIQAFLQSPRIESGSPITPGTCSSRKSPDLRLAEPGPGELPQGKTAAGQLRPWHQEHLPFDQDAISQILERFASDEGVSDDFMTMLDAVMDELQRELESPEVQQSDPGAIGDLDRPDWDHLSGPGIALADQADRQLPQQ